MSTFFDRKTTSPSGCFLYLSVCPQKRDHVKGWTIVVVRKVRKEMFQNALTVSYCNVAPKRLSEKYRS